MRLKRKQLLAAIVACAALYSLLDDALHDAATYSPPASAFGSPNGPSLVSKLLLLSAISEQRSDIQLQGEGVVIKVLPDDTRGSKHQKFLLEVSPGKTVLVAHNIDLAPRVPNLKQGDGVHFYGEFEWNDKGGVVHWTHRDPRGQHPDGWLKHRGVLYQ